MIKSASNELTTQKRYKYVIYFTDKIWLSHLFVKYRRLKTFQSPLLLTVSSPALSPVVVHKSTLFLAFVSISIPERARSGGAGDDSDAPEVVAGVPGGAITFRLVGTGER